jgi:AcrR family transcriptional regulator
MPPGPQRRSPTTAKRSTANRRGDRSRAAILQAAMPLFAQHGYRGAPLSAVANAVEMTQPGLLHHFPSKEHLLMAVLEERDLELRQRMRDAWSEGGSTSLNTLKDIVAHNETTRDLVQMFTVLVGEGVSADHPAHDFFVERYAHLRQRYRRAVTQGQDAGEMRADVDTTVVAALIVAIMDGLQIQWLLDDEIDMRTCFAMFLDMLLQYVAPEPKS